MRYAVLASLLLHVLLLWPAALRPPASETRAVLQATVRMPQPPRVAEPGRPPPAPAVSPAPTLAPVLSSPAAPAPVVLPPQPLAPPPPASTNAVTATPTAASTPPIARSTATAAITASGTSLTANATSAETLDGLRGYRLAIASQARRFKRYPAEAKASGWAGSTEVRLEVGAEGQPRPATVARSSGYEALDRAALAMIDAGAARARLPDSLRGREFAVMLPVEFRLDEQ
jgi:protein TonB